MKGLSLVVTRDESPSTPSCESPLKQRSLKRMRSLLNEYSTTSRIINALNKSEKNERDIELLANAIKSSSFYTEYKQFLDQTQLMQAFCQKLTHAQYVAFEEVHSEGEKPKTMSLILQGIVWITVQKPLSEQNQIAQRTEFIEHKMREAEVRGVTDPLTILSAEELFDLKYPKSAIVQIISAQGFFGDVEFRHLSSRKTAVFCKTPLHLAQIQLNDFNSIFMRYDRNNEFTFYPIYKVIKMCNLIPLFSKLNDHTIETVLRASNKLVMNRGQLLFKQENNPKIIYVIAEGEIELREKINQVGTLFEERADDPAKLLKELEFQQQSSLLTSSYRKKRKENSIRQENWRSVAVLGPGETIGEESLDTPKKRQQGVCRTVQAIVFEVQLKILLLLLNGASLDKEAIQFKKTWRKELEQTAKKAQKELQNEQNPRSRKKSKYLKMQKERSLQQEEGANQQQNQTSFNLKQLLIQKHQTYTGGLSSQPEIYGTENLSQNKLNLSSGLNSYDDSRYKFGSLAYLGKEDNTSQKDYPIESQTSTPLIFSEPSTIHFSAFNSKGIQKISSNTPQNIPSDFSLSQIDSQKTKPNSSSPQRNNHEINFSVKVKEWNEVSKVVFNNSGGFKSDIESSNARESGDLQRLNLASENLKDERKKNKKIKFNYSSSIEDLCSDIANNPFKEGDNCQSKENNLPSQDYFKTEEISEVKGVTSNLEEQETKKFILKLNKASCESPKNEPEPIRFLSQDIGKQKEKSNLDYMKTNNTIKNHNKSTLINSKSKFNDMKFNLNNLDNNSTPTNKVKQNSSTSLSTNQKKTQNNTTNISPEFYPSAELKDATKTRSSFQLTNDFLQSPPLQPQSDTKQEELKSSLNKTSFSQIENIDSCFITKQRDVTQDKLNEKSIKDKEYFDMSQTNINIASPCKHHPNKSNIGGAMLSKTNRSPLLQNRISKQLKAHSQVAIPLIMKNQNHPSSSVTYNLLKPEQQNHTINSMRVQSQPEVPSQLETCFVQVKSQPEVPTQEGHSFWKNSQPELNSIQENVGNKNIPNTLLSYRVSLGCENEEIINYNGIESLEPFQNKQIMCSPLEEKGEQITTNRFFQNQLDSSSSLSQQIKKVPFNNKIIASQLSQQPFQFNKLGVKKLNLEEISDQTIESSKGKGSNSERKMKADNDKNLLTHGNKNDERAITERSLLSTYNSLKFKGKNTSQTSRLFEQIANTASDNRQEYGLQKPFPQNHHQKMNNNHVSEESSNKTQQYSLFRFNDGFKNVNFARDIKKMMQNHTAQKIQELSDYVYEDKSTARKVESNFSGIIPPHHNKSVSQYSNSSKGIQQFQNEELQKYKEALTKESQSFSKIQTLSTIEQSQAQKSTNGSQTERSKAFSILQGNNKKSRNGSNDPQSPFTQHLQYDKQGKRSTDILSQQDQIKEKSNQPSQERKVKKHDQLHSVLNKFENKSLSHSPLPQNKKSTNFLINFSIKEQEEQQKKQISFSKSKKPSHFNIMELGGEFHEMTQVIKTLKLDEMFPNSAFAKEAHNTLKKVNESIKKQHDKQTEENSFRQLNKKLPGLWKEITTEFYKKNNSSRNNSNQNSTYHNQSSSQTSIVQHNQSRNKKISSLDGRKNVSKQQEIFLKLMSAKVKKAELESKGLLEKATTQKIIE